MPRLELIHTSRSIHPMGHITDLDILRTAENANSDNGITGFLIRVPHRFAQFLEGPAETLALLFDRICRDPRHFELIHHMRPGDGTPSFANWSMGYATYKDTAIMDFLSELACGPIDFDAALGQFIDLSRAYS